LDTPHRRVGPTEPKLPARNARRTYVRSQQLRLWNDVLYSRVPAGIGKGAGVNQKVKLPALLAALALTLVVVSSSSAAHRGAGAAKATGMVYAGASDPTYLDPALVSDGESFRVTTQIFEGLVALKPGTTTVIPALAKSWANSKDGKTWTFFLRKGVKFHDNTPFNAKAVCYNFNRWYNFSGAFQDPGATFYYQSIFTGFKHNEDPKLGPPLYKSCAAKGNYTAVIKL